MHQKPDIAEAVGLVERNKHFGKKTWLKALNDFYSLEFAASFMKNYPEKYIKFHQIDPESPEGMAITALRAINKLKGNPLPKSPTAVAQFGRASDR